MHRKFYKGQSIREFLGQLFIILTVGVMMIWVPTAPLLKTKIISKTNTSQKAVGEALGSPNRTAEYPVLGIGNELLQLAELSRNLHN